MKYISSFRVSALLLTCVFLLAVGYAGYTSAQAASPAAAPADVAAEKAENVEQQGEVVKPEDDNEQAKAVRPQEEAKEATEAVVDAVGTEGEPRIGVAKPWQVGMQEPASPVQERLFSFHHALLIVITVISIIVLLLLIYVCVRFRAARNPVPSKTAHNTLVEIVWTIVPVLILFAIGVPALKHLYYMDHSEIDGQADLTIKIIGYQWYWNYEYPDSGFAFDSYIIKEDAANKPADYIRLLSVDNAVVVPVNKKVLLQLTGGDVIHSWAMPAFGVKLDAVPGHLNETWFQATKIGTYYGQCSELCGVNHGFMPITVRVVTEEEFQKWLEAAKAKFAAVPAEQRFAALAN